MESIDPLIILPAALVMLLVWQLSGMRKRRLRRKRAQLRLAAHQADTLQKRHQLMMEWKELGGLKEYRRGAQRRGVREEGQKARVQGRPLSANPYGTGWWGQGRQWKRGWQTVERHIRWIESHR